MNNIPRRILGGTGEEVSILTFGGFHLMEVLPSDAEKLLKRYMDFGGNLIETAISYGDSESKIGRVLKDRRKDIFLSTKTHLRTKKEAAENIDTSLKNLRTDHIDNLFMHAVNTRADMDAILSEDGAMAAALEAKQAGKLRYIGITSHNPENLYDSLQRFNFDIVMEWLNYYDYFNFPFIYDTLLPYIEKKNIGLIAMKPIADGLLYRSVENAFRWCWSLPVASVSAGNNTLEMLDKNIALASAFEPMTDLQKQELYMNAPEYAQYVCRRCAKCQENLLGLDLQRLFELEGHYDRQMYTGSIPDAAEYALRERLRFWFGNQEYARNKYKESGLNVPKFITSEQLGVTCPYGVDLARKVALASWKLTGDEDYLRHIE